MIVRPSAVLRNIGLVLALVGFAAILPTGGGQPALAGPISVDEGQPASVKATSAAASKLLTCGSIVDDVVKIPKDARETLSTCNLTVPEAGQIFVSANGSAGFDDAYARVLFRIKIDGSQKYETDRYMAVFDDTGDGSDASVALSGLFPVAAGSHVVSFLGLHNSGSGTLRVYDPALTVLFIPGSGTDLLTCSDMDSTEFSTSSIDFVVMRTCTLTLPGDGWAFISADGSALGTSTPSEAFEAAFTIGIDDTTGTDDATRWVDAYGVGLNGKDAVDRTIALTMLKPVSAGRHTFNFVGRRTIGSSNIRVASPSLSVIYMPAPGLHIASCGVLDRTPWTTTSPDFSVVRQCGLNLPEDSVAFIAADANLGLSVDPFEAHLRLGIDSTEGDGDTDRYVNVYPNSNDGTDDSAAVTVLKPVTAGNHTFYLLGRRILGPGTILLRYATLTVIVPVSQANHQVYLPLVMR